MGFKKGHKFQGYHVNTPSVYSHVDSNMRSSKTNGALNIALIGESKGGIPGEIIFLDDPEVAKETLKSGDLLDGCLKAYDPVIETKDGVGLGGADLIFAIRSNQATKAKTSVYQDKQVEAKIGKVVSTLNDNSTGKLTTSGAFTGDKNITYKVVITSEGTKDLKDCKCNYMHAKDNIPILDDDLNLSASENSTNKAIGDGVEITFEEGKYSNGDYFLIPCTAEVTENEFVFEVESKDFGEECNLISHKVEDGTTTGTKKLIIHDAKKDEYEEHDNMGGAFSFRYNGSQPYAAVTIVSDGKGNSIKLQTTIGTDETNNIVDLDIDLNVEQFKSIKSLAEYIAGFEGYEIETTNTINPDLNVNDLDFVTDKRINNNFQVTAVLRDFQKSCAFLSDFVEVNIINREVSNFSNYPFVSLIGGTEGRNATSFVKFLDELGKYDIDYIVPLTDDLSILAEVREHCILMSRKYGKERRMVCGGGNGIAAGLAVQLAKKLSHQRVQFFGTGFYDRDEKLYPGYISAAMHAGRAAFLGVESATGDIYNILKPEIVFSEKDRSKLIDNGVMFFDEVISDYNHKQFYSKLVWDYTTFSEYNDPLLVERSTGSISDMLSKDIRKKLDKMLTGKLTPTGSIESAKNAVISILQDYQNRGIIVAYKDVQIKKKNDRTDVSMAVAPTEVNNFTFVNTTFYSQNIEA